MENEFSLALPYPEVDKAPDERDVLRLYDLYAGRFSEMTAICSYVYQSVVSSNPCVARLVKGIASIEMRHLDLLAGAIFALGGDPVFAGRYNYFSGRYADCENDLRTFIRNDVYAERNAAESYRATAEASVNPQLKELLCRIAMDEELHVELLTRCFEELFGENAGEGGD